MWFTLVVRTVAVAFVASLCIAPSAFGADRIYWANQGNSTISFANLDGTGGGQLPTTGATASAPHGVAIDSAAGRIYWANFGNHTISFANLDGTGGGGQLTTAGATVSNPLGLAIDPAAQRVYWTNASNFSLAFANLDGTGGGVLNTAGSQIASPRGAVLDPAAGRIYWGNTNTHNSIAFAALDGSGGGGDLPTPGVFENGVQGVAIDPATGRIYWANGGNNTIASANLDGSGGALLSTAGATVAGPIGVALDRATGRIYWANDVPDTISFANLDGSGGGGTLPITGATPNNPRFVALLKSPAGAGAPDVSGGGEVGQELACSQGSWATDIVPSFLYRAPHSFAFQWHRNGAGIDGATEPTYKPTEPGEYSCRVTAANAAGSATQTSAPRTVSVPEPPPPDGPIPELEITDVKRNENKGTAELTVQFNPSGSLRVDKTNKVRGTNPVEVEGPGTAELTVHAMGKALKRLARRGKVTVNPRVLFDSPDGAVGKRHKFKLRADVTPGEICLKCFRP